jgi:hypothetical protein
MMVGVPRFELGSKAPKAPSIGQTNPYALELGDVVLPMNFTQEEARFHPADEPAFHQVPSAPRDCQLIVRIHDCQVWIEHRYDLGSYHLQRPLLSL